MMAVTGTDVRVLIVDDHEMVAHALARMLTVVPEVNVVGVTSDERQAVQLAVDHVPDILLIDVHLSRQSGFDVAADIRRRIPGITVVFLSGAVSDVELHQALALKCGGYLLKGESLSTLLDALQKAARGERVYSDSISERIEVDPETGLLRCKFRSVLMTLTPRQLDVLRHLARGLSVKDTVREMHLSTKAVESQKYRLMKQLEVHDRVGLSRLAIREGLVEL